MPAEAALPPSGGGLKGSAGSDIEPGSWARGGAPSVLCLEKGGVVAVFPEGDFGLREGELLPFKKGFAHFAVDAGVQVLPVALAGMKDIWLGKRLCVRIGEPISTAGKSVDEVHRLGQDAVTGLLPQYTETAGRKPLRRWLTGLF